MTKAVALMDQRFDVAEGFRVELNVFEVVPDNKYPSGIKARYVLIDEIRRVPLLLVDNHEPFGFHAHEELPAKKNSRRMLKSTDHIQALSEFWKLVKEIINHET